MAERELLSSPSPQRMNEGRSPFEDLRVEIGSRAVVTAVARLVGLAEESFGIGVDRPELA